MKKLKIYHIFLIAVPLLFVAFLVGFFLRSAIKRFDVIEFFNSNFFVAIVTLAIGSVAIFLYQKQRNDNKRDMAKLILQEIRYAEDQIRKSKTVGEGNFLFSIKLLPTSSWHKNIHLFISDLKESQIDLISYFYSQASYLDEVIHIISKETNKKWTTTAEILLPDGNKRSKQKDIVLASGFGVDVDVDSPSHRNSIQLSAREILSNVVGKIEFIYNSSAVDKLRDIAEGKI